MRLLHRITTLLAAVRLSRALELIETTSTYISQPSESALAPAPLRALPVASETPPPSAAAGGSNSSIASISFSGNGCPQNGGGVGRFANHTGGIVDGQEIVFGNFTAVQQAGAFPPSLRTLNCQMHLAITGGDAGWQVSPDLVSYGGFAVLDPESSVSFFVTTYWSQDASYTFTSQTTLSNPGQARATRFVGTSVRSEVWSPCVTSDGGPVGNFNMNFRVSTVGGGGDGGLAYFGPLELSGREVTLVKEQITYKWRRCQR